MIRTQRDRVNMKWFHFDHVLATFFDFPGRSEVFMDFLWCGGPLEIMLVMCEMSYDVQSYDV